MNTLMQARWLRWTAAWSLATICTLGGPAAVESQETGVDAAAAKAKAKRKGPQLNNAIRTVQPSLTPAMGRGRGPELVKKPAPAKGKDGAGDGAAEGEAADRPGAGAASDAAKGGAAGGGKPGSWDAVGAPAELQTGIEYKKPKPGTRFSFNLVDADLIELIKIIGNITGKSFILGAKTPSIKATIYAPTKITAGEAYEAFLSVLQVNGLTVMPSGRYLKVLPIGGSVQQNTPIFTGKGMPDGDQIVTRLHRLENVSAEELSTLLDRFKSAEGDIAVYVPTNTLIITDWGSAITRLLRLVELLDVPGTGEQIWIEPINYASATDVADRVMEIFDLSGGGAKKAKTEPAAKPAKGKKAPAAASGTVVGEESDETKISKILADERTNSLIIVASESAYLRILELVKKLDVPIAGEGTIHVHKLQHADAVELAKTLANISRAGRSGASSTSNTKGGTKKAAPAAAGAGGGTEVGAFEGDLQISADKATNSLVIVSSFRDYVSLKTVIDALDSQQRQVFVEAVIMEVSLDKNRDLGLGFHAGNTVDTDGKQSLIYGSSQPNDKLNSLLLGPGAMSGLAAGVRGPDLEGTEDVLGPGISIPAFGVALQALQTNSDVNVLSTPYIATKDGVEASISVGENVPVQQGYNAAGSLLSMAANAQTGSGTTNSLGSLGALGAMGGLGGLGTSIGRQNVGLTLKITPVINDDSQVRLEVDLEISEVKSVDPNLGPNISKQNAVTTLVAKDQQTVVIGGLITDNQVETTQKVPVLGDIPILGFLFRHKSSLTKKRNLLIFLTPYIIRDENDTREIYQRKLAERREFIERYTAFEYHRIDPHLDWSRTNGAVAELNRIISQAEHDEALRRASQLEKAVEHTPKEPIPLPRGVTGGIVAGGSGSGEGGAAPPPPTELPLQIITPEGAP